MFSRFQARGSCRFIVEARSLSRHFLIFLTLSSVPALTSGVSGWSSPRKVPIHVSQELVFISEFHSTWKDLYCLMIYNGSRVCFWFLFISILTFSMACGWSRWPGIYLWRRTESLEVFQPRSALSQSGHLDMRFTSGVWGVFLQANKGNREATIAWKIGRRDIWSYHGSLLETQASPFIPFFLSLRSHKT